MEEQLDRERNDLDDRERNHPSGYVQVDVLSPSDLIVERLGQPIIAHTDGTFQCPVCDFTSGSPVMGPHISSHWQETEIPSELRPRSSDVIGCPVTACGYRGRRSNLKGHLKHVHKHSSLDAMALARVAGFDPKNLHPFETDPTVIAKAKAKAKVKKEAKAKKPVELACPFCEHVSPSAQGFGSHLMGVHGIEGKKERDSLRETAEIGAAAPATPATPATPVSAVDPRDAALAVVMSFCNGSVPSEILPDVIDYIDATRAIAIRLGAR